MEVLIKRNRKKKLNETLNPLAHQKDSEIIDISHVVVIHAQIKEKSGVTDEIEINLNNATIDVEIGVVDNIISAAMIDKLYVEITGTNEIRVNNEIIVINAIIVSNGITVNNGITVSNGITVNTMNNVSTVIIKSNEYNIMNSKFSMSILLYKPSLITNVRKLSFRNNLNPNLK